MVIPNAVRDLQLIDQVEVVEDFTEFGVHAFTTTRQVGSFSTAADESVKAVMGRWDDLRAMLAAAGTSRLATASQVHGNRVVMHTPGWDGWLRMVGADGHATTVRGTALGVTIADCVPVFIGHQAGAIALLHSGWRGTAARITEQGIARLKEAGLRASDLRIHLGPAICGRCYEVSPEVIRQLTGENVSAARTVDLRALIADHARAAGVRRITISSKCTRCDNDRFYSHRAGDVGRQLSIIATQSLDAEL